MYIRVDSCAHGVGGVDGGSTPTRVLTGRVVMSKIEVIGRGDLATAQGQPTAGMDRREAGLAGDVHAVEVPTAAGRLSGWHRHASHATYGYVLSGWLRFETGARGEIVIDGGPGGFFFAPPPTVHREGNPAEEEQVPSRGGGGQQAHSRQRGRAPRLTSNHNPTLAPRGRPYVRRRR